MNPPSEQLVRDYLNRVSVAARGSLGSAERRALLTGTCESIESAIGTSGTADAAQVRGVLAALGDPDALIARYQARLAAGHQADGQGGTTDTRGLDASIISRWLPDARDRGRAGRGRCPNGPAGISPASTGPARDCASLRRDGRP